MLVWKSVVFSSLAIGVASTPLVLLFWTVILIDSEGKAQYAMDSMTMMTAYDAVEWILNSTVEREDILVYSIKVICHCSKSICIHVRHWA